MTRILKHILILLGIFLALAAIVTGSILPLMKARSYIDVARNVGSFKSFEEFKSRVDYSLSFYSPVGDEEIAKFFGSQILGFVSNPEQSEPASRVLVAYAESFLHKNDTRQLITLGRMYSILWERYGQEEDAEKAKEYFFRAFEMGPNLPQPLYGLFDIYREVGDTERLEAIATRIVELWPEDENVQATLRELRGQ